MDVRRAAGLRVGFCAALAGAWLVSILGPSSAVAARPEPPAAIAVFDFELVDTSLQGELEGADPEETARLGLIGDILRERLARSPRFRMVDTAPAADAIKRAGSLRRCNGCELEIAAGLGADLALIGWVQKVSNLILNINISIRDVATGRLALGASVDIRGNTDQSWERGIGYLIEHRILANE